MPLYDTKDITLPGGETVTIRELSVAALKEADQKGTEAAVTLMRALPENIVEAQLEKTRDLAMERIIRYEGYDPETLLMHGIVSWSFPEECNDETKAQLGARHGEIIARAIFKLSVLMPGEAVPSSLKLVEAESQSDSPEPTTSTPSEAP